MLKLFLIAAKLIDIEDKYIHGKKKNNLYLFVITDN